MLKIPNVSPLNLALIAGAVVALGAVVFVASRKAGGDKRGAAEILGAAIASTAANAVVGVAVGGVKGIGEAVGIPDTSTDKCAAAMAAGSTWDASLYCPAATFLKWTKGRLFGENTTLSSSGGNAGAADDTIRPTLRRGSTGTAVSELQGKLGITADGIFGAGTEAAVKKFQSDKLLIADGVVGVQTWAALDNGYAVVDQNGVLTDSKYRDLIH